jgi:predicted MPP superfamily phosphohydrolase
MRRILGPIFALLLAATWFAVWTFAHFEGFRLWPWALLPLLLIGSFFPLILLSYRTRAPWLAGLSVVTGVSLGFLTYFVLAAFACGITWEGARALGIAANAGAIASWSYRAAALAGLAALYGGSWLRTTHVTIKLAHLPAFWDGRTIALVSDIHLGNFRGAGFSRRVVARLMTLRAECILVGGDMFDGVKIDVARAVEPWSKLRAPSGVYFVGGNHDDYGGRNAYFAALRRVGMRVLENEKVEVHGLQLVGVHDQEMHRPETYRAILERAAVDRMRASILLAHRPENLAVPEAAGISLQLSGHTHGGQFWPWTLVAGRVHGRFARGLHQFGRMAVFTSTGAGTWGPPFRLGTRSEVVLIRLEAGG